MTGFLQGEIYMFKNSGKKIKFIAELFFYINCFFIIMVCGLIFEHAFKLDGKLSDLYMIIAILEVIVLPILCWICTLFVYGYGELIDKTCEIEKKLDKNIK